MSASLTAKPSSFIAAMRHFFGFKEGQKLSEFSTEVKDLSPSDREYFAEGLRQDGYPIPPAMVNAA